MVTSKVYVGKTVKTLAERFTRHCQAHVTLDSILYKSMRKHGIDNFQIELVEACADDIVDARDIYWIKTLNTINPCGYNMTKGGTGGDTSASENYQNAIREYHKNADPKVYATMGMLDKKHSNETKAKQAGARKKMWDSLDLEERQARNAKVVGSKNGMFGKKPANTIKIKFRDVVYNSINDAVKATGISYYYVKREGVTIEQ